MNQEDIHIISRHSNWTEKGVDSFLKDEVYSDARSWKKFLQILLITLGVGFCVSGIVFFFAYNWDDLHKFVKIGLTEALVIGLILFIVFSGLNQGIKNTLLTGTAVLVGVMIAVFGQIYQTGANAYDFFMGWTLFISVWVFISNFPPLWLVYLILANTTFILYSQQVASDWTEVFICGVLFLFNGVALVLSLSLRKLKSDLDVPSWFAYTLAFAALSFSTIGICIGIFDHNQSFFLILILTTVCLYGAGIVYGLRNRSGFFLSVIPLSLIIIFSAILIRISDGAGMFFMVSLFLIISVTFLIKILMDLQKRWSR
jgi:uncharacterized membrane protein